jgi:hypothetical protein
MMRRGVGEIYDRGVIIHRWWFIIVRRGAIFINVAAPKGQAFCFLNYSEPPGEP